MSKRILTLVHGDKGGVGKSMTANSVADYLISSGSSPKLLVVDADQRNPDVSRMYSDRSHRINLLEHEGWNELYDLIEANPESDILVNLPAQAGKQIPHEVEHLKSVLADANMELVMFFVLDRQSDTVNLLTLALADLGPLCRSNVAIVKNLFFGASNKFDHFEKSPIKAQAEKVKASILEMPDLNTEAAMAVMGDYMSNDVVESKPFTEFLATRPRAGIRLDLQKWIGDMFAQYANVYAKLKGDAGEAIAVTRPKMTKRGFIEQEEK